MQRQITQTSRVKRAFNLIRYLRKNQAIEVIEMLQLGKQIEIKLYKISI